ncbi:MAG TPA: hypothetical protein VNO54_24270, partial [Streptosporangiaceae bacterium]|nr:hypothetical protein [Streptosporangiaceae bacterium]
MLYDDGTSLTTVSEPIAHSLAEAERQRGRHVTVRRLDDDADGEPESALTRPAGRLARPEPISEPEPTAAAEPAPAPEPAPHLNRSAHLNRPS